MAAVIMMGAKEEVRGRCVKSSVGHITFKKVISYSFELVTNNSTIKITSYQEK